MAHKITITLPDESYSALSEMAKQSDTTDDVLAAKAVEIYIRRNRELFCAMQKGYGEMGDINLEIAEEFLAADNELLLQYEEKLSECE